MKLTVVLACLNEEKVIGEQLEALANQREYQDWGLVVVDNGSTDSTRQVVRRFETSIPNLRLVDASERQSQPFALNKGVSVASGRHIAFCDADDVVSRGWIAAMGRALENHEFVAGPFDDCRLNRRWIAQSRENPQRDGLQQKRYLPFAGSGNMGVHKWLFESVGGFDDTLPYLFDVDFCWRVQEQSNIKLYFAEDAVLHVRYRSSLFDIFRQAKIYSQYKHLLLEHYGIESYNNDPSWSSIYHKIRWGIGQLKNVRTKAQLGRWCWDVGWQYGKHQYMKHPKNPPEKRAPGKIDEIQKIVAH